MDGRGCWWGFVGCRGQGNPGPYGVIGGGLGILGERFFYEVMAYDPARHHRRSIRLKHYDYVQPGAYFVTICVQHRQCLFGHIDEGKMYLNTFGTIVDATWQYLPQHFQNVEIDAYVTMPNHVHGIVIISDKCSPNKAAPKGAPTLGQIVAYFKYQTTKEINRIRRCPGARIWQRNYYEAIIRDERMWHYVAAYIQRNPLSWWQDQLHPQVKSKW